MSEHSASRRDQQIRSLREPKPTVDPWRPIGSLIERERRSDGSMDSVVVIFLAGRECPFTCVFCDLWSQTLDGATPLGSLPRQIDLALQGLGERAEAPTAVKLYNASNFFDPLAVPDADLGEVVRLVERFDRVTVESHPRYVGRRSLELAERLRGGLEVAMGLESIHPRVLPRLNKAMSLADFESATETLRGDGIAVRAFVLLGVPFLAAAEQVEWAVRSAEYAISVGAGNVSLIPTRGGNGEMERLASVGEWTPPSLGQLEAALEACVGHPGGVITADTWDLEALASCGECFERRRARLETMNLTGAVPARLPCGVCGWGTGCLG